MNGGILTRKHSQFATGFIREYKTRDPTHPSHVFAFHKVELETQT